MTTLFTIILFVLLTLTSSSGTVVDFCVADLKYPEGPSGYLCRDPAKVTVDDFVFSKLSVPGNTSGDPTKKVGLTFAIDNTFPGLNGLGLSMYRIDIGVGGASRLHSHRATEVILLIEGKMMSAFIDSNNKTYYKTMKKGDIMIYPPSLLHAQVNLGDVPIVAFGSFNSANPGLQYATASFHSEVTKNITY